MIKRVRQGIKKFWATVTLVSVELLVTLIAFFGAMLVFVFLIRMVFFQNREEFDQRAFRFMNSIVSYRSTEIMEFFSLLGTHYFLIPANLILVFYFAFIRKHRWYSIRVPVIALSSMCMMFLLKLFFKRERPLMPLLEAARGMSFPSGHATMSCSFYGLLIYMIYRSETIHRTVKIISITVLSLLIVCVGASRVYLRVHYASDVIAGFCLGLMWLMLSIWILKKIEVFSSRKVKVIPSAETVPTGLK
ncbi:phosphatase PAP2 family protein [Segetibacter sp. 3557_3]|uniref:phosphatase PAP2 family protein n=1 Tax=Segetibacter sp. 3557_3 TaxID=2547429 RepID=UPI001058C2FF|nr:phosphatase PAP2 family protein [Segetibacter sp. 3557_3]TDH25182.1 phosphatase PAP2 family protein [Segetibacter sp. 3557_3]